jgi:phosphopantothenoylcysteine decarboxylase/phosphopantothenate--cysteine ligase
VLNFKFFEELKALIVKELKSGRYDILIHSAAVSDYRPQKCNHGKVSSAKKRWELNLVPTEKLINGLRKLDNDIFLVGFKFEPKAGKNKIVKEAYRLMQGAALDLAVANTSDRLGNNYQAFILSNKEISGPYSNKNNLSVGLIQRIKECLCRN